MLIIAIYISIITGGLIYNLLNKPVTTENRFLCSEFVYYILNESGIIDFNISRNLVKPQDFLKVDGKIVYQRKS